MEKLHDVDSINNPGFLLRCLRPGFVYTRILCVVYVFFTVPKQNDNLAYHDCPGKNVLFYDFKSYIPTTTELRKAAWEARHLDKLHESDVAGHIKGKNYKKLDKASHKIFGFTRYFETGRIVVNNKCEQSYLVYLVTAKTGDLTPPIISCCVTANHGVGPNQLFINHIQKYYKKLNPEEFQPQIVFTDFFLYCHFERYGFGFSLNEFEKKNTWIVFSKMR